MAESFTINNETFNFNKIWYVDDTLGDDSQNTGLIDSPFKTYEKQITSQGDTDMIYIKKGTYTGFINGSYGSASIADTGKNITVYAEFGTIFQINGNSIPKRDCHSISFVNQHSKVFNIRFEYIGKTGQTNYSASVFGDINASISQGYAYNCTFVLDNYQWCYDNSGSIIKIINCNIIQQQDPFNTSYGGQVYFTNCQSTKNLTYANQKNYCLENQTIDNDGNITNPDFKNLGDPSILNVDGTRSDIGLYGGPYSPFISTKLFLLRINNQLKKFNDGNNTFEDISDNLESVDNFNNFGQSINELLPKIKDYGNISQNFELQNYTNAFKNLESNINLNHKIVKIKDINLNDFEIINYIRLYLKTLNNLNNIKVLFKQNNQYISLRNNKICHITLNNIVNETNNLLSIYEFNNLSFDDLFKLSYNNQITILLYVNDINKLNNISLKGNIIGNYKQDSLNYTKLQNMIKVDMTDNGNYIITLRKV